ncbi:SGNH/GDSL hydrolase family protein [Demequina sp.]|uniref:SGNH/GDSL hydrolase family protein n=1 Tax=Demequina sp. TaxID=2050685 RepID=UPI0025D4DB16|nr:SGNH/GDSL hydrolase family protein [Demequina sp.]
MRVKGAALLLAVALTACAPGEGAGGAASADGCAQGAASSPLRVAVVGDSLSYGTSAAFTPDGLDESSYVWWALGDDAVLAGGTAVPGATSLDQRERAGAVDADVLILALGTNDLAWGIAFDQTSQALRDIAAVVGAPRVLLLAIPPLDPEIDPTTPVYNRQLRRLADAEGWTYVDAPAGAREGDGWAAGMTGDGVHYTVAGARIVGEAVAAALC